MPRAWPSPTIPAHHQPKPMGHKQDPPKKQLVKASKENQFARKQGIILTWILGILHSVG